MAVRDICEADQGFPELAPLRPRLLVLQEQVELLLYLPMQLLKVVLGLTLQQTPNMKTVTDLG